MAYYVYPHTEIGMFTDSSLDQYYISNCLTILDDVVQPLINNKIKVRIANACNGKIYESALKMYQMHHLCLCYDILVKNGLDNLICDMLNTVNKYDMLAICLVAIINERTDIMEKLVGLNFDFGQAIMVCTDMEETDGKIYLYSDGDCSTILSYAIHYNKITIVKYLLQNDIKMDLASIGRLFSYINNKDISLFDDFYHLGKSEMGNDRMIGKWSSLDLLMWNIDIENNKVVERLLSTDPNLDPNLVKSNLEKYEISTIGLDTLKILINYGFVIDNEFSQFIFERCGRDTDIIDFLMAEYSFVPTDDMITKLFQDIKYEESMAKIRLLAKHNIDLSNIKYAGKSIKSLKFIESIKNCNLDLQVLTTYLLDNFECYN